MTQQQREKLTFIAGRVEGIAYGVDNENLCDVIMKCSEDIDRMLKEDADDQMQQMPRDHTAGR